MTIVTIQIADESNPVEVQTWLDLNSAITPKFIVTYSNLFYIFY